MAKAADVLKELGIDFDMTIISAQTAYAKGAEEKGYKVIIAEPVRQHIFPGMCSYFQCRLSIPMKTSNLGGVDSCILSCRCQQVFL